MTDYTIPMIIGMTLAFMLGAGFGALWGLSRHEWLYCRVTAHLTRRMREAMKSLGIEEWQIDKAQEYMSSVIIPPHIPMPEPPVKAASEREQCQTCLSIAEREQARPQVKPRRDFGKEPYTMDEVVRRLSPHGDRAGDTVENLKQLGNFINSMGVKAYLEMEETMTRLPVFKRIGWFRRMMLRLAFGLKYIKKEE